MAQTRIFRDRIVSMEQTLEGGEKQLELLKGLCLEALPEFQYREHALDHERDLFVMTLEAPDGRRKTVCWTRMVLFDAERIPALSTEPNGELRVKVVEYLKSRASRPEILVTFRHLEQGWVDTPEPRPSRRRRRRGRGEKGGAPPPAKTAQGRPGSPRPTPPAAAGKRPAPPAAAGHPSAAPAAQDQASAASGRPRAGSGRRRFRRRRRGRGGGGSPSAARTP